MQRRLEIFVQEGAYVRVYSQSLRIVRIDPDCSKPQLLCRLNGASGILRPTLANIEDLPIRAPRGRVRVLRVGLQGLADEPARLLIAFAFQAIHQGYCL